MDLSSLLNYVTMVAAAATVLAVQLLKSNLIPAKFQNYPVPTTLAASAVATYLALLAQHFSFIWGNTPQVIGEFVTVVLVAVLTYTHLVKQWPAATAIVAPKLPSRPTSASLLPGVAVEPISYQIAVTAPTNAPAEPATPVEPPQPPPVDPGRLVV